jgi:hypothetical protein
VGTIKPEADTEKVVQFVITIFTLWLETKGIRIGSIGSMDNGSQSSGISKMIDEMDVWELQKKSMEWFEKDEKELWNVKLPKIHNYWIKSGMVNAKNVPPLLPDGIELNIDVEFDDPAPMKSKKEMIEEVKAELEIKTMTLEQAIKLLHPEYSEETIAEILNNESKDDMDKGKDIITKDDKASTEEKNS